MKRERLPADIPTALAVVARAAGLPCAKALADRFGGQRISVPKRIGPKHRLAQLCGEKGAAALAHAYGGGRIDVPLWNFAGIKAFLRAQRRAILARDEEGQSAAEIARSLRVTERVVHKHRALKRAGRQHPDLFDGDD